MEFISYFLAAVVCFLGLIFGAFLAFIAPEELEKGRKYFIILRNVLLALIFIFMIYFWRSYWIVVIFVALLLLNLFKLEYTSYMLLAIVLYISSKNIGFFLTESLLIFLYGFPTGTLFAYKFIKEKKIFIIKKLVLSYIWFLILAIVLFLF